ncbi:MAG: hypothetical protein RL541_1623, partial [Pseudomonadota bacterium]
MQILGAALSWSSGINARAVKNGPA